MSITFQFKEETSPLFGTIRRPIAHTLLKHISMTIWQPVTMIVDTGADYTLLPRFLASLLGITLTSDCRKIANQGVGGSTTVYLIKQKIVVKIGSYARNVPLGFLINDYIPPLLGRQEFFETFRVVFEKYQVTFG